MYAQGQDLDYVCGAAGVTHLSEAHTVEAADTFFSRSSEMFENAKCPIASVATSHSTSRREVD